MNDEEIQGELERMRELNEAHDRELGWIALTDEEVAKAELVWIANIGREPTYPEMGRMLGWLWQMKQPPRSHLWDLDRAAYRYVRAELVGGLG